MTKEQTKKRDGRIPLFRRRKIGIKPDKNFAHRLVVDPDGEGSKIEVFEEEGWEKIPNMKPVHVGSGKKGYYMRLPIEDYENNQKEKQKFNDEIMEQIKFTQKGMLDGLPPSKRYGKVEIK